MANNSQSRQPAASRPPLPPLAARQRRYDYEVLAGHDLSRYNVRDDWGRHHLNAVYEMPNAAVVSSYHARRDDMGHYFNMQHDSRYYSRDDYPGRHHVNALYDHQLPTGQGYYAAFGVGGGRPEIQLPPNASTTLFVEGLPAGCTRREVSHIFRPFIGYKDLRLVTREPRQPGGEPVTLCFAEFISPPYAARAMDILQGQRAFGIRI